MKKFLLYFFSLIALTVALMLLFDWVYTYTYANANPRNKMQYLVQLKDQKYDVVFLGSSRVANHIDSKLFNELSHQKTLNLGIEGAELNDNLLELKLLLNNNTTRFVFLEIDENLEVNTPSNVIKAQVAPYVQNEIINAHAKAYYQNSMANGIPFYRYAINDAEIGFREMFCLSFKVKPNFEMVSGYIPKQGHNESNISKTIMGQGKTLATNPAFNQIKAICKEKNIKLVLFIAPYCSKINPEEYITKLKQANPDLIDLSKGYNDSLFFNCSHLNEAGSKILTKKLFEATKDKFNN